MDNLIMMDLIIFITLLIILGPGMTIVVWACFIAFTLALRQYVKSIN